MDGGDRASGGVFLRGAENHRLRGRFLEDIPTGVTDEGWWSKHGPPAMLASGPAR